MGKKKPGFNWPIIVKYLSYKSKEEVLRNASKLKTLVSPKGVNFCGLFTESLADKQKLWQFASRFRDQDARYRMTHGKLHVNSLAYVFDHVSGLAVQT